VQVHDALSDPVLARSFLYVPADRPDRVAQALASVADAVIVDLEDAVKSDAKSGARASLPSLAADSRSGQFWVRINSGAEGLADLDVLRGLESIDGVVVAKCGSTDWLDVVAAALDASVEVAALIESAVAWRNLDALCAHPRLRRCHVGEVDLLADVGARLPGGQPLLDAVRVAVVVASAAGGLEPPVGGVHLEIADLDALARTSSALVGLGFGGRAVVHPTHCAPVNQAFSPSPADLAWAADVLARWDAATGGALRAADGTMIDEAVVRRARAVSARNA